MGSENGCVLVTGATSGFGLATASRFARGGWRVYAAGRRGDRLGELSGKHEGLVTPLAFDITDDPATDAALASIDRPIDVLVNNAGLALGLTKAHEASWGDWDTMISVNVRALAYVTRKVLPGMVTRNRGHIVNIGSVAGAYPYPGSNAYGATKAFVAQFSLNLRADLLGAAVRVTSIEPGLAATEFSNVRFHGDTERARKVYEGAEPLTGDDIAEAVWWCVTLPPHVNINRIEIMPVCQTPGGPLPVARK